MNRCFLCGRGEDRDFQEIRGNTNIDTVVEIVPLTISDYTETRTVVKIGVSDEERTDYFNS